ncbi:MAG: hypothetical protein RLZZ245_2050, partial [Verrucomicrobiota bacterium]
FCVRAEEFLDGNGGDGLDARRHGLDTTRSGAAQHAKFCGNRVLDCVRKKAARRCLGKFGIPSSSGGKASVVNCRVFLDLFFKPATECFFKLVAAFHMEFLASGDGCPAACAVLEVE